MNILIVLVLYLYSLPVILAQPVTNSQTAPNTFPNRINPTEIPVAPSDSIYETSDHSYKPSTAMEAGTFSQDTTNSEFKGVTRPGRREKAGDPSDNKIIVNTTTNNIINKKSSNKKK